MAVGPGLAEDVVEVPRSRPRPSRLLCCGSSTLLEVKVESLPTSSAGGLPRLLSALCSSRSLPLAVDLLTLRSPPLVDVSPLLPSSMLAPSLLAASLCLRSCPSPTLPSLSLTRCLVSPLEAWTLTLSRLSLPLTRSLSSSVLSPLWSGSRLSDLSESLLCLPCRVLLAVSAPRTSAAVSSLLRGRVVAGLSTSSALPTRRSLRVASTCPGCPFLVLLLLPRCPAPSRLSNSRSFSLWWTPVLSSASTAATTPASARSSVARRELLRPSGRSEVTVPLASARGTPRLSCLCPIPA